MEEVGSGLPAVGCTGAGSAEGDERFVVVVVVVDTSVDE